MIYGNPHWQHVEAINNSILLQQWIPAGRLLPLVGLPMPDEETTINELLVVTALTQNVSSDRLAYCIRLDDNLMDIWAEYLGTFGITTTGDELYAQVKIYEPIIEYLKVKYNRPRPYQLAALYNIPLYPRLEVGSTESAYPSGHTLLSLFVYDKYSKSHPELRHELMNMVLDVKRSREEVGVHYPSDGVFSFKVYDHIKQWL